MFDTGKTTKITVTNRGVGGGLKGVDHDFSETGIKIKFTYIL